MDKDFPKMVMFKFYFYQGILWFKFESVYRFAGNSSLALVSTHSNLSQVSL